MATFGAQFIWGVPDHYPGVPENELCDWMYAKRYQWMLFL
jgi:hypothetical protein